MDALARGTGAMLAASAATLAAPRQQGEGAAAEHAALLCAWAIEQLNRVDLIEDECSSTDFFFFSNSPASKALAAHALNATTGLAWVSAVATAVGGTGRADLPAVARLARLLTAPQAGALQHSVQNDSTVQARLLSILLPTLLRTDPEAAQDGPSSGPPGAQPARKRCSP